jgi:AraC-like DNA-binding protein
MTTGANALTSRATPPPRAGAADTVAACGVSVMLQCLERLGYDADALAGAVGLRRRDLDDPDGVVACTVYGDLIARAQAIRFTPNLGLRLGSVMPIGAYALLDYLILTSPDVEAGLHQLARYFVLVSNPLRVELSEAGGDAEGAMRVAFVGSALPFSAEMTTAILVLHFKRETEGRFAAAGASFMHRPDDLRECERLLGCRVEAGARWNGVVIPAASRRLSLRRRDAVLRSVLERQADEIIARLPRDCSAVTDVRRALESRIGRSETGIRDVARHLAVSPRTLQRRLASEGSSYQALLEEWRKETARRHLSESKLAVSEVAFLLDYSEPAPFHRAFKRWFGVTPQEFRQTQRR